MSRRRYRIAVFGKPRGEWHDRVGAAMSDAIKLGLASYDEERGEHYLAVPVEIEQQDVPA